MEFGPYRVSSNLTLVYSAERWPNQYDILFSEPNLHSVLFKEAVVDQPVGTGFSYTQSESGYVTNADQVRIECCLNHSDSD